MACFLKYFTKPLLIVLLIFLDFAHCLVFQNYNNKYMLQVKGG
jgi:hypothetical protein